MQIIWFIIRHCVEQTISDIQCHSILYFIEISDKCIDMLDKNRMNADWCLLI
jgi:hypothetical protein